MKGTCLLAGPLLVAAGVVLVGVCQPSWRASRPGAAGLTGDEPSRQQRARELDSAVAALRDKTAVKSAVASSLARGETTFLEAGALFYWLDYEAYSMLERVRESGPGDSPEERACRQVILWTSAELTRKGMDEQAGEIERRLELQLCEHVAGNGRVHFPDMEPPLFLAPPSP